MCLFSLILRSVSFLESISVSTVILTLGIVEFFKKHCVYWVCYIRDKAMVVDLPRPILSVV